ncbi:MAG: hypothetical protein PWP31_1482 [Clostridia bacterium]|nr:hypothetical protein [Clostridia bacterium]MDK2901791.1 hypothetical protein [Thermosediminibacterales bacterium]
MLHHKIRSVGDIHIETSLSDGPGIRITREFLTLLVKEFAKQS